MTNFAKTIERFKPCPFRVNDRISPSEEEVLKFERHIGTKLPEDFRNFIATYAGIDFEIDVVAECLDSRIDDGYVAINYFYGFYKSDNGAYLFCDLFYNYNESKKVDDAPWLPIIFCPYGNQIFLSIGGNDKGSLYFLDHEEFTQAASDPTQSKGTYLVNHSFEAFINSLRPYDDE